MQPLPALRAFFAPVLLLALFVAPAFADEKPKASESLPLDPALERMSGLPNGMQYWIRPHEMPAGKVVLFMHVSSGSLNEEDDQRGLAHFLEHMAFNGSKHFAPGELIKFFESMGMRFGQHQNAFTSFDETTYILSLPDTKPETISKGLLFFSDVGRALSILPAEVDKERGVIEEEARARAGVQMRMMEKVLPVLLPGSRVSERLPIGTMEVVKNAPTQRLRDYWEKWYRPDLTTLIVVGDIDPKAVEPLIKQAFADWKKPAAGVTQATTGMHPFQGVDGAVFSDPEQTNVEASINFMRADPPMRTVGDFRRDLAETLGQHIFNRRLRTLSQENEAEYVLASMQAGMALAGYEMYGFEAQSPASNWAPAFAQLVREVRRAVVHGFGEKELERARAALLSQSSQLVQAMPSIPSMMVGQHLNRALTRGRKPMSAAQMRDLTARLLPEITAAEVQDAFVAAVDLENTFLTLTFPEKEGVAVPTKEALLAAYKGALEGMVTAQKERASVGALMERDPEPASVAARTQDEELEVTSLTFANGARVHIKPIPTAKTVSVNFRLYGGVPEEEATTKGFTEAAAIAFAPTRSATRKLKPVDIGQYLAQRQVSVGGGQDDISLTLGVSGPADQMDEGLRLAWLLLTEPQVDQTALAAWKQQMRQGLERVKTSAPAQAGLALRDLASSGDLRFALGDVALYEAITREQAQGWLNRIVRTAPIEVVISGGIDAEAAEKLARTWVGSLPARPDRFEEIRALRRVKRAKGPVVKDVELPSITPMAIVLLGWRGVSIDDGVGQIALSHATSILSSRLIDSVREERGLTYSVGAGYQYTDYDNMDGVIVQFTAAPDKASEAAQVAKQTMLGFLEKGPTPEEIAATESQMANVLDEQIQTSGFWQTVLSKLHGNGRTLAEVKARLAALRKVDKDAMMKTLRTVLQESRHAQVIAKPAPKKPALPEDTK